MNRRYVFTLAAALSLVAPEKNRFRVKLEGWDRDWQDVGNRRQACGSTGMFHFSAGRREINRARAPAARGAAEDQGRGCSALPTCLTIGMPAAGVPGLRSPGSLPGTTGRFRASMGCRPVTSPGLPPCASSP